MAENREEQKKRAVLTLATMLDYLKLDADLRGEATDDKIQIKIASDDAGRIIGRKGQTLESLQLLLNRIVFKGEEDAPRIDLDIDGYVSERKDRSERGNSRRRERGGERRERGERDNRRERGPRHSSGLDEEALRQQALDAAKEAKRWGEAVSLPAMNAHDRRIIHVTLQDDPQIITESEGDGARKRVIVSVKKD